MLARPSRQNTLVFTDTVEMWTWLVVVLVSVICLGRVGTTLLLTGVAPTRIVSGTKPSHSHPTPPIHSRADPLRFFTVPRAAIPGVLCLVAMHWVLLWRVLLRRRWACVISCMYGWLFFEPYWGRAGWLGVPVAGLFLVLAASVVVGWRELADGW
jgi:hypothetical protein